MQAFLYKVFGPCARHTPVDEVQRYFSDRDREILRYQTTAEDMSGTAYLDLSFNNLNYKFLDNFGDILKDDTII